MLKSINFFLAVFFISNFAIAQNNISIKKMKSKYDCHNCPGKLIVSNGQKTDTIHGGSWGNPPSYLLKKIDGKEYLVFDGEYFDGGFIAMNFTIRSLSSNTFLKVVLKKEITISEERFEVDKGIPTNYITENKPTITYSNPLKIVHKITEMKCPETKENICKTIKEYQKVEYVKLKL